MHTPDLSPLVKGVIALVGIALAVRFFRWE